MHQQRDIAVIGAGIVGLATALRLQLEGRCVTLLDPNQPASGCSAGNAGYLSSGNFFPIASAEVWRKLPRMLCDPLGPLVIRPGYLLRLAPWGLRLLAASRSAPAANATEAIAQLTRMAIASYAPLLDAADAQPLIERRGGLHVYRHRGTFERKAASLAIYERFGIAARRIEARELREMEPAISHAVVGAILFPGSAGCLDPQRLGQCFARRILAGGGRLVRERIRALEPLPGGGWKLHGEAGHVVARQVVVAAGRWSDELLRPLGYRVPLEGERGYHLMLPRPAITLTRPVVMVEHYFVATPMNDGLRLAGTVEFAARDAAMDPRRSDMLFEQARPFLPGLSRVGATRWMGTRPTLADSIPAIGRAAAHSDLFYNFGHQHCGLTLAAISAHLLADLIAGRTPPLDPRPYDLARFGTPKLAAAAAERTSHRRTPWIN